ncbi:MAG: tRNA dihydrouridine(20/20a) synthase DusA, partial [Cyanobacteriota bacterium]|nr:tRNA dihydrouridine(20/20a) synthase DusA [Cyanobacteriota bacterium]
RWTAVDAALFGSTGTDPVKASTVLRGLIDYSDRWCSGGGRLWAIARHLVHLVEGVPGARRWRQKLTQAAVAPGAGPEVIEQAARQLEAHGT